MKTPRHFYVILAAISLAGVAIYQPSQAHNASGRNGANALAGILGDLRIAGVPPGATSAATGGAGGGSGSTSGSSGGYRAPTPPSTNSVPAVPQDTPAAGGTDAKPDGSTTHKGSP